MVKVVRISDLARLNAERTGRSWYYQRKPGDGRTLAMVLGEIIHRQLQERMHYGRDPFTCLGRAFRNMVIAHLSRTTTYSYEQIDALADLPLTDLIR